MLGWGECDQVEALDPEVVKLNRQKPLGSRRSTPSVSALGRELGPNGACSKSG
jgi:hypothetical protein